MKWFGKPYGAPYEADSPHEPTPVGEPCLRCGEAILEGDSGLLVPVWGGADNGTWRPYHYECHLRGVIGGLYHQLGQCKCCGGTLDPDPKDITPRQAAILAVAAWNIKTRRRAMYSAADETGAEGQQEMPHDKSKRPGTDGS